MFLVTLAIAVACVLAISIAPLYSARVPLRRSVVWGSSLVLAAVGILCCCAGAPSGTVPLRGALSLAAFPLFLAGSLLLSSPISRRGHPAVPCSGMDRDGAAALRTPAADFV